MSSRNKRVAVVCLLWLRMASSKVCSDGVCSANELKQIGDIEMDHSNDLSFVQVSAMEKRAQETATSAGTQTAQSLDAAVYRKGGSGSTDSGADGADDKASKSNSTKSSTKSSTKNSTKNSTKESSKVFNKTDGPWSYVGEGCCEGKRTPENGKLFGLNVSDMDTCKKKCRTFNNCGMIEFGWTDMPQWCYGWGTSQKCEKRDKDCVESVPGNGKGVQGWLFTAPKIDIKEAMTKYKWEEIGPGCCAGAREESNGKLYANKEATLDACKARCLSFDNCGIVEYGWTSGDPEWCYIWDDSQKCKKMDLACKESAMGNGFGAKAYRLLK